MKNFILKWLKKDRRKFRRHIVKEVTPCLLCQNPPEEAFIRDLSLGGISITYLKRKKVIGKTFDLDIKAVNGFQLGKVAVETISDSPEREKEYKDAPYRRLRGRFIDMSKVQQLKLRVFLENFQQKIVNRTSR